MNVWGESDSHVIAGGLTVDRCCARLLGLGQAARLLNTLVRLEMFSVLVRHSHTEVQRELVSRLTPYFDVSILPAREARTASPTVVVDVAMTSVSPPKAQPHSAILRANPQMPEYHREVDRFVGRTTTLLHDSRDGVWFALVPREKRVAIAGTNPIATAKACRRLVQDVMRLLARRTNILCVEASAVLDESGAALLFIGQSGSGKTSLLTRVLAHSKVTFIANEEVFLIPRRDCVLVHGSPVHVMITPWLATRTRQLHDISLDLAQTAAPKKSMHFRDYANRFGSRVCPRGPLLAAAFLRKGTGFARLSDDVAAEYLNSSLVWGTDWQTPLADLIPNVSTDVSQRTLRELAHRVPFFDLGRRTELRSILRLANAC